MKTITIHQGNGDDLLEMTVEVTNKEYAIMEKIRKTDPSVWEGREFELLKMAKDAIEHNKTLKKFNWKFPVIISVVLVAIIGVFLLIMSKGNNNDNDTVIPCELKQRSSQPEHLCKIYNKLVELDVLKSGSYEDFVAYCDLGNNNRQTVYYKAKTIGYTGTYKQFLEYAGYSVTNILNESQLWLYNKFTNNGFALGSEEQFLEALLDDESYEKTIDLLYD